jgi:PAS domain S-box-containing protein
VTITSRTPTTVPDSGETPAMGDLAPLSRDLWVRQLLDAVPDGMLVVDAGKRIVLVNRHTERLLGYRREELIGQPIELIVPPAFRERYDDIHRHYLGASEEPRAPAPLLEAIAVRRGGADVPVELTFSGIALDGDRYVVVAMRDVVDRRAVQRSHDAAMIALRESEERFRATFEQAAIGILHRAPDTALLRVNRKYCEIVGYTREELLRIPYAQLTHPEDVAVEWPIVERLLSGETSTYTIEKRLTHKEGHFVWVRDTTALVRDEDGTAKYFIVVAEDITERRRAEETVRVSEERYRLVTRATKDVVYDWDVVAGEVAWNDAVATVLGHLRDGAPLSLGWWESRIHDEDRAGVVASLERALERGEESWSAEYRFERGDGSFATVLDRGYIIFDADRKPVRMIGSMVDISERQVLEEQLRQSQKMEAIGRLAGGVAHDFNNLLTVIGGSAAFLLEDMEEADPRRTDVEEIRAATHQAASLTQQLLAFSRRQVRQPRRIDVNAVVAAMRKMLRRLIPEHIEIVTSLTSLPWTVEADPGQLEQALINLAVNARDAMPSGGRLTIATENATTSTPVAGAHGAIASGEYVLLAVTDSGIGMDASIQRRIFEPFFTTKEAGRGTGLGLSTVYSIVSQSGGHITVESAPGRGTRFSIYLPRVSDAEAPAPADSPRPASAGSETVLVVEDEAEVRSLVRRTLERAGYRVLVAADGAEAAQTLRQRADEIDVLLTDVVLPMLSGRELAEFVATCCPRVRVMFMSGYVADEALRKIFLDPSVTVLEKPFSPSELTHRLRHLLDT